MEQQNEHATFDTEDFFISALVDGLMSAQEYETVPDDWWQALKKRWLPLWLKGVFPVKEHDIVTLMWCPHMKGDFEGYKRDGHNK